MRFNFHDMIQSNHRRREYVSMGSLIISVVILIHTSSCKDDRNNINNPFPHGKDTLVIQKDTWNYNTIQALHAGLDRKSTRLNSSHRT